MPMMQPLQYTPVFRLQVKHYFFNYDPTLFPHCNQEHLSKQSFFIDHNHWLIYWYGHICPDPALGYG